PPPPRAHTTPPAPPPCSPPAARPLGRPGRGTASRGRVPAAVPAGTPQEPPVRPRSLRRSQAGRPDLDQLVRAPPAGLLRSRRPGPPRTVSAVLLPREQGAWPPDRQFPQSDYSWRLPSSYQSIIRTPVR